LQSPPFFSVFSKSNLLSNKCSSMDLETMNL
jgi:hypothetical protein